PDEARHLRVELRLREAHPEAAPMTTVDHDRTREIPHHLTGIALVKLNQHLFGTVPAGREAGGIVEETLAPVFHRRRGRRVMRRDVAVAIRRRGEDDRLVLEDRVLHPPESLVGEGVEARAVTRRTAAAGKLD